MKILQKIKEWKLNRPESQWSKKKLAIAGAALVVAVGLVIGGKILVDHWQFKNYKVITRTELEDTTTTAEYAEFGDYILKYGGDGVTLLNAQGEEVWNEPQTMENPVVAMRGEYCVVYDKKGTDIGVYNFSGRVTDIQTKLPVEKVCINPQGITGVVLADGEEVWNEPQTMENPVVAMRGEYCVVYDKKGTDIGVYNFSGRVTDIQTKLPVEKVCINPQGITGVVLADGEITWIHVYDQKGEELVTAKTSVDNPGYPVDLSLSDNGQLMAVSYLCVKDNQPASFMAFYNFGNTGQNQMDNQVSGYNYVGTLIPQVNYLSDSQTLAFSDNGFLTYSGKQIPEESNRITLDDDILSVFHDDQYVGMAYKTGKEKKSYEIVLYTTGGAQKAKFTVDFAFDHVALSKEQIFVYNEKEVGIYTLQGNCRYQGTIKEGNVENIFRISGNRYMVILDSGTETIRLQ